MKFKIENLKNLKDLVGMRIKIQEYNCDKHKHSCYLILCTANCINKIGIISDINIDKNIVYIKFINKIFLYPLNEVFDYLLWDKKDFLSEKVVINWNANTKNKHELNYFFDKLNINSPNGSMGNYLFYKIDNIEKKWICSDITHTIPVLLKNFVEKKEEEEFILPEKWYIKVDLANPLNKKLKKWIKKSTDNNYYDNRFNLSFFHFPNYNNYNGFEIGSHTSSLPRFEYEEITYEQFVKYVLKEENTSKFKIGDKVRPLGSTEDLNKINFRNKDIFTVIEVNKNIVKAQLINQDTTCLFFKNDLEIYKDKLPLKIDEQDSKKETIIERMVVYQDWWKSEITKTGWESSGWSFSNGSIMNDNEDNSWDIVDYLKVDKFGNAWIAVVERITEI